MTQFPDSGFVKEVVSGFSNTMKAKCRVVRKVDAARVRRELLEVEKSQSLCARGSGISYADMILNDQNSILDFSIHNHKHIFSSIACIFVG